MKNKATIKIIQFTCICEFVVVPMDIDYSKFCGSLRV